MNVIRISFNDEDFSKLEKWASEKKMSVQDYIRVALFKNNSSVFTPEEAERRAIGKLTCGDTFSLPDLYEDDEWGSITRGEAGVFGKRFYRYVEDSDSIQFIGMVNRRARYQMKARGEEH